VVPNEATPSAVLEGWRMARWGNVVQVLEKNYLVMDW
jgi:hypothetical protein